MPLQEEFAVFGCLYFDDDYHMKMINKLYKTYDDDQLISLASFPIWKIDKLER